MPTVSVIVPTFNREKYVIKAIDSILEQTYRDFEIIVVDDGSTDGTRAALERYGGQLRYLYQQNSGVSSARNAGIAAARGAWIAYLDSDDEWRPGYLAAQMASAGRYPQAVAHVTNSISLDMPSTIVHYDEVGMLRLFRGQEELVLVQRPFRTIVSRTHWFLQPMVMRRDVLLDSGLFNPGLTIAEDMDVVARLSLKGPFTFNRLVLVEVIRRQESIQYLSAQYMARGIYSRKSFGKVFTDLLEREELTFLEKAALCKTICRIWRAVGNLYMISDRQSEARKYYRKALFLYPSAKAAIKYCGTFMPQQVAMHVVRKGVTIVPGEDAGGEG